MSRRQFFAELYKVLANIYPTEDDARRIASDADLDISKITFSGKAINTWNSILFQARNERKTDRLMVQSMSEYKENEELCNAWHNYLAAIGREKEKPPTLLGPNNSWFLRWISLGAFIVISMGMLIYQNSFVDLKSFFATTIENSTPSSNEGEPLATVTDTSTPINKLILPTATLVLASQIKGPNPAVIPTSILVEAEIVVNSSKINIRQGPGTNYPSLGVATQGERYKVIGKNPTGDWWQIDYMARPGWVLASLVTPQNINAVQVALNIPPSPTPTTVSPTNTLVPNPISSFATPSPPEPIREPVPSGTPLFGPSSTPFPTDWNSKFLIVEPLQTLEILLLDAADQKDYERILSIIKAEIRGAADQDLVLLESLYVRDARIIDRRGTPLDLTDDIIYSGWKNIRQQHYIAFFVYSNYKSIKLVNLSIKIFDKKATGTHEGIMGDDAYYPDYSIYSLENIDNRWRITELEFGNGRKRQ